IQSSTPGFSIRIDDKHPQRKVLRGKSARNDLVREANFYFATAVIALETAKQCDPFSLGSSAAHKRSATIDSAINNCPSSMRSSFRLSPGCF
ncbi:hypothetical protein Tco_1287892, partial [Tanacetum coccineum]